MIADFKIDANGDIILNERPVQDTRIKASFFLSKHGGQKISFFLENYETISDLGALKIRFDIVNEKVEHQARMVEEKDALAQLLRIKFKTQKGSLIERPSFGTLATYYLHSTISETNINNLAKLMEEELSSYLQSPKVEITRKSEMKDRYKQFVNVKIFEQGEIIYEEKL